MSTLPLTKLTISRLRGSVNSFTLPFVKEKKLTIIYGENGTGKSTICDALEFLGNGKIGSLDNRGLGTTTPYWHNVNASATDISVELEFASTHICKAQVGKKGVVLNDPEMRPRVEVLRRSQILSLLEATPGHRYTAISRFIDVSPIETAENNLRSLFKDLNNSLNIAAARINENREAINQFWEAAGAVGTDPLNWAENEVQRTLIDQENELEKLRKLQSAYESLAKYPNYIADAEAGVTDATQQLVASKKQVATISAATAGAAAELVKLLQAARNYLHVHPTADTCPLCERSQGASELDARLAQRLQAFSDLQHAQQVQQDDEKHLQTMQQRRELVLEELSKEVALFNQICADPDWPSDIALPTHQPIAATEDLNNWLIQTASLPEQWNAAESARQERHQFIKALTSALETYTENLKNHQELSNLLPNLQRTLEIVQEERKRFTDTILGNIAKEVGRLYEAVHPGEDLNSIELMLNDTKRASLDIKTTFSGKSAPPQAYFSQAHLDTLGLCVFLALAALDAPENTILVLDDVLASVDEPHVDRLITMLYEESLKFRHCLITTHYGPWRHKLRWGWLKNNQCHFVELSRWSTTEGISVVRSIPEVERLRALLTASEPDLQSICSKSGVILEAALDFLTQLYECSVPRKAEPRYTLGELLPAIKSNLRKLLHVEMQVTDAQGTTSVSKIQLEPILDELTRIMQTRNVMGAHFNAISFDLLDSDAFLFAQKVLELIDALVDPAAGWPRSDKSGSFWTNSGETRRLYPLKKP